MNRGEVEEIVQNTVRKINSGPEACLTNPRVLSFFNIMKDSFHRCLKSVTAASTTPEELLAAYKSILAWSPSRVAEEVDAITKRYPSLKDSYTYAAVYIVEQTYKKENKQLKLKLPSFQHFLFTFYNEVLNSVPFQTGSYETLQFFEKEMLCCQAFCNALYNSIRTEPVARQQSVIVEQSEAAVTSKKDTRAIESHIASASRFSARALSPFDSVSQMVRPSGGATSRNPGAATSRNPGAATSRNPGAATTSSAGTGTGAATGTTIEIGALTEETLNRHRNKMKEGHPARSAAESIASAATASMKTSKPKTQSVKVIHVDHPQKHTVPSSELDTYLSDSSSSSDSVGGDGDRDRDRRFASSKEIGRSYSRRDEDDNDDESLFQLADYRRYSDTRDRHEESSVVEGRRGGSSSSDRDRRHADSSDRRGGSSSDDRDRRHADSSSDRRPVEGERRRQNPNRRH